MSLFIRFLTSAIRFSTVFIFGASGEIINQKSGHLNMGTPGIMYLGALGGIVGERIYLDAVGSGPLNPFLIVFIPIIFAMVFGAIGGAFFSFFTVTLKCNQNVTGLTLTTLAVGISCLFIGMTKLDRMGEAGMALAHMLPFYTNLGWFGEIFLSYSVFTYLAIIIAILTAIFLKKTRIGLNLRAVGENAAASDSAGINVQLYRYIATIVAGAISGIGGAFFELDYCKGMFNVADGIDAYGWLALCIVIFALWKPILAILASFLFACLYVLPNYLTFPPTFKASGVVGYLLKMAPYIATLIVLILMSIKNNKKNQPPANLGASYFREDR